MSRYCDVDFLWSQNTSAESHAVRPHTLSDPDDARNTWVSRVHQWRWWRSANHCQNTLNTTHLLSRTCKRALQQDSYCVVVGEEMEWSIQAMSLSSITCHTISNPHVCVFCTDTQDLHKQVVSLPWSRYDCGLQTSSRIWPTRHRQGDRPGLWIGDDGSWPDTWGSFCHGDEASVRRLQNCL